MSGWSSKTSLITNLIHRAWIGLGFAAAIDLGSVHTRAEALAPEMRLHMIDVGQGEAMLLEFPCGAGLIDTGGESNDEFDSTTALTTYLEHFFEKRADLEHRLSFLVLSHPHVDHTRGVEAVLRLYKPRNIITNGQQAGSGVEGQKAALAYATATESAGTQRVRSESIAVEDLPPHAGYTSEVIDPINCGAVDPRLQVLWGAHRYNPGWSKKAFDNNNNHSVTIRLDFGAASFLFGGDLEREAITEMLQRYRGTTLLDVDVYKVGHHGSDNGTTADLLQAVTPKIAIMSMGSDARQRLWTAYAFGHPRKSVIDLLQGNVASARPAHEFPVAAGARLFTPVNITKAIYATGWDGNFVLRATTDGKLEHMQAAGALATQSININNASANDLMTLQGIGSVRAAAIVKYRNQHPFKSVRELLNVPGIGWVTFQHIKAHVSVGH
jgi:competence protein ComEC